MHPQSRTTQNKFDDATITASTIAVNAFNTKTREIVALNQEVLRTRITYLAMVSDVNQIPRSLMIA